MPLALVYDKNTGEILDNIIVKNGEIPNYDQSTQSVLILKNPPKTISKNTIVKNGVLAISEEKKLKDKKQHKKQEIEIQYERKLSQPIKYNNNYFHADAKSREIMKDIVIGADDTFETQWKTYDKTYVKITKQDLKNILKLIVDRGEKLFFEKEAIKKKIEQAQTIEELNAITWS